MRRIKLTPLAKILIVVITVLGIAFGFYKTGVFTKAKNQMKDAKNKVVSVFDKNDSDEEKYAKAEEIVKEEGTINISLDEWIG